ncbi:MAG TPA: hypothetical protein DIS94_00655 [Bacteroidetes bacterium]|nr:hypothetical protein [Bacteroidota bacterium]
MKTIILNLILFLISVSVSLGQKNDQQFYYPASHNWVFSEKYPDINRLLNSFDYGHAVLYEELYNNPENIKDVLETEIYNKLVNDILKNGPDMNMPEESIAPNYSKLAWNAMNMFDWAHKLHRQSYDILADDNIKDKEKEMKKVLDYYLSNEKLAFIPVAKSMDFMDKQYYSKVFREKFPKYNGLVWAYHYLQIALYDALMKEEKSDRENAIKEVYNNFWNYLKNPPESLPQEMPMTMEFSPEFSKKYPEYMIIFDNLHMMHDVISDILANESVKDKSKEIELAIQRVNDKNFMIAKPDEHNHNSDKNKKENKENNHEKHNH